MRHKQPGDCIEVADLESALAKIEYQLRPLDIVLLQTGADKRLGSADYFAQPPGTRRRVLWLVERGTRVIGIDAYTLDRPFSNMVPTFAAPATAAISGLPILPALPREYCQIEKLANLDRVRALMVSMFLVCR